MQMLVTDREPDMFERDSVVCFNYGDLFLYGSVIREQHFEDGAYLTIWLRNWSLVKSIKLNELLDKHDDGEIRLTDSLDTIIVNVSKIKINKVNIRERNLTRISNWVEYNRSFVDHINLCLELSPDESITGKCLNYLYKLIKETDNNGEELESSSFRKETEIKWLMTIPMRHISSYLFTVSVTSRLTDLIIKELEVK